MMGIQGKMGESSLADKLHALFHPGADIRPTVCV